VLDDQDQVSGVLTMNQFLEGGEERNGPILRLEEFVLQLVERGIAGGERHGRRAPVETLDRIDCSQDRHVVQRATIDRDRPLSIPIHVAARGRLMANDAYLVANERNDRISA
jgi:hypothetical protein